MLYKEYRGGRARAEARTRQERNGHGLDKDVREVRRSWIGKQSHRVLLKGLRQDRKKKEESKLWLKELGGKGTFIKRKKKQVGEREN